MNVTFSEVFMEYRNLIIEETEGIAIVKVSRPKVLNALNSETLEELKEAAVTLDRREEICVVILTGDGERAFIAGADIQEMKDKNAYEGMIFSLKGHQALSAIESMRKPVIAAVNGYALGGGLEVALACDIIYASEKARLGFPEVSLGIHPGFGGTQRTAKILGLSRAKELIFTGRTISAQEALEIGLVSKVVPHERLMEEVLGLAKEIKANGPIAVSLAKELINRSLFVDMSSGLLLEAQSFGICFATHDQKEGMTAFLEKRKPSFKGR